MKPLICENDREEIERLLRTVAGLKTKYIPVCKIGEGSFSRVYKALDLSFYQKKNAVWMQYSHQDELDGERMKRQLELHAEGRRRNGKGSRDPESLIETHLARYCEEEIREPQFVALKFITQTSSPTRILDEIMFLNETGGRDSVIPLIEAFRCEDCIVVVFPLIVHSDFRSYFKELDIAGISTYMRLLLTALANIHAKNIIHRDIKPSNFIFLPEKSHAVLVDFGLAQRAKIPARGLPLSQYVDAKTSRECLLEDRRPSLRASRAGTRGFRAPEVLFKHIDQTTALDIWSAGVILLILLTRRYPFFTSYDDLDALIEVSFIFGTENMGRTAYLYKRRMSCDIPGCPEKQVPWQQLCVELNPDFACEIPPEAYDLLSKCLCLDMNARITAEEALEHPFVAKQPKQ